MASGEINPIPGPAGKVPDDWESSALNDRARRRAAREEPTASGNLVLRCVCVREPRTGNKRAGWPRLSP